MTTLREILRQYADTGSLEAEYMTLAEYEALKVQAGNMSQDKERNIISRDERIFELQTENEALSALLRQWAEIGPNLHTHYGIISPKLYRLINDTKAALDAQPGNKPGTLDRAD
jgi:hypothetical protein